jgi:hypothetical protein
MAAVAQTVSPQPPPRKGFRRFWLALKQLFHELVGALFGVFALFWTQNAFRAWSVDAAHWLVGASALLAVLMTAFSFTSFRNARRVQAS